LGLEPTVLIQCPILIASLDIQRRYARFSSSLMKPKSIRSLYNSKNTHLFAELLNLLCGNCSFLH